jgi:hypothetical protein
MSDAATLTQEISKRKATYATKIARLERNSHSSLFKLVDLRNFARDLHKQCSNTVHLEKLSHGATTVKAGIFRYVRDTNKFAELHTPMAHAVTSSQTKTTGYASMAL